MSLLRQRWRTVLDCRCQSRCPARAWSPEQLARALELPPPTDQQRAVIAGEPRHTRIVAGAGSGKTDTMASRMVWLIANGIVDPERILGLTFTRKAASELTERIDGRLRRLRTTAAWQPETAGTCEPGCGCDCRRGPAWQREAEPSSSLVDQPTVSTYHAYAGRLVSEHGLLLGYEPDARLLTEAAMWQLAADVVARYDGDMDSVTHTETSVTGAVIACAAELAEHAVPLETATEYYDALIDFVSGLGPGNGDTNKFLASLRAKRAILPIVAQFVAAKKERDVLDFADQMSLATMLATTQPQVGEIERDRFSFVILDEFQDTSSAQLEFLAGLFARSATQPLSDSSAVPVTAVGDPHQSIYGWRGASAGTMDRFLAAFADTAGSEPSRLTLSTSWRNDVAILDAANQISQELSATDDLVTLSARPDAGAGWVGTERYLTIHDEARRVASWLADQRRRDPSATAAVLCRKRSQFPALVKALEQEGVPHEVHGLGGLLTTAEIQDLVALLSVVADPSRGDQLMRLLTGPPVALGACDLVALHRWARHQWDATRGADPAPIADREPDSVDRAALADVLDDLPPPDWRTDNGLELSVTARQRLTRLSDTIEAVRRRISDDLADLVSYAERELGLDQEVAARPGYTPAAARAHLDAFIEVADSFADASTRPTLSAFLAWLAAAEKQERGLDKGYVEPRSDAVSIMTIHSAKGLEWDLVCVPGMVEGTFPAGNLRTSPASGRWTVGTLKDAGWIGGLTQSGIPYDLRGDRDALPQLHWRQTSTAKELKDALEHFRELNGDRALLEERRLAYVAITRARRALLLSGYVWGSTQTPKVTSRFLTELAHADASRAQGSLQGAVLDVDGEGPRWAAMPPTTPAPSNPLHGDGESACWPDDPFRARRDRVIDAVGTIRTSVAAPAADLGSTPREEELLLAERDAAARPVEPVATLPTHLSASELVLRARDEEAFVAHLLRPMPAPPPTAARRGTAFHAWVEAHFAQPTFLDLVDLPGSADGTEPAEADLGDLQRNFLASQWAQRTPIAIEVDVETVIDGIAIRGRVDAIFEMDGDPVLVDWKSGRPPTGDAARAQAVQLGAYAIAWSRLSGVAAQRVRGAFFYAATGETVWPELPDEEALRELLQVDADVAAT